MEQNTGYRDIVQYAARAAALLFLAIALLCLASQVFLLVIAGILVAVFLSALAQWVQGLTKVSYRGSLGVVLLSIIALLWVSGYFAAPSIGRQMDELADRLPRAIERLEKQINEYPWGRRLLSETKDKDALADAKNIFSRATGALSITLGFVASLVIVLFIGVYAAVEPSIYRRGFLVLIPTQHRDRTGEVVSGVVDTLQWWLIGKFISMTIIGVLTTVGLWIMGIPLALALGIIAAIFTFIPNIGPVLSAIPAVLLGLIDSPQQALYIAALYVGIQTVESFMITPLIQRKTVSLPPALTLSAQVLLGVIFGGLGVALATPMAAAALVLTRMLYVDDTETDAGL
jgi:predicted PurR-regulated permease PerM